MIDSRDEVIVDLSNPEGVRQAFFTHLVPQAFQTYRRYMLNDDPKIALRAADKVLEVSEVLGRVDKAAPTAIQVNNFAFGPSEAGRLMEGLQKMVGEAKILHEDAAQIPYEVEEA